MMTYFAWMEWDFGSKKNTNKLIIMARMNGIAVKKYGFDTVIKKNMEWLGFDD